MNFTTSEFPQREIEKGPGQVVRISRREYNGKAYIDVRQFFESDDGEWLPTKKGVTFRPDQLPEVIDALEALRGPN